MKPLTITQRENTTQIYTNMKNLIAHTTWKFHNRYGGDFEELLNEANLLFIKATQSHNEARSKITTWTRFCIWKGLLNYIKKEHKQWNPLLRLELPIDISDDTNYFSLSEILDELSDDAKDIIKLIFDLPLEIQMDAKQHGNRPRNIKAALYRFLYKEFSNRIKTKPVIIKVRELFEEITTALEKCSN